MTSRSQAGRQRREEMKWNEKKRDEPCDWEVYPQKHLCSLIFFLWLMTELLQSLWANQRDLCRDRLGTQGKFQRVQAVTHIQLVRTTQKHPGREQADIQNWKNKKQRKQKKRNKEVHDLKWWKHEVQQIQSGGGKKGTCGLFLLY